MPTSNNDELTKAKMYAVVDGERVKVMELQGKAALSEAEEDEEDENECIIFHTLTLCLTEYARDACTQILS